MKENTYRLLAKIGSIGIFWILLEKLYNFFYPFFTIIGFNISDWINFIKEVFTSGTYLWIVLYQTILFVIFVLIVLPLWYFGWKKN